ncbi:hypothetical protein SSP531S_35730 [Streptomyces spongiicola]|uniref:Helix-turn-helix domain-containing protein n=1 Tax=Streptomyces spongiicola TaxID=1690221 RepID=A0A388T0M4_9ACTN|nr:hypothetical protein [Streptomyces spongiicola]GBQ02116.1 hypothetical protein SSP531S_35730 [Streptomyces spongiicola]
MDTQNPSVRPHAQSRISGKIHPRRPGGSAARPAGVIHDNTRHTSHFTVIGNHLAQHRELSGLAIGLGVHIQSLKAGSLVDIRTLAGRFPEGQARIAAALRELEVHGYLRRPRERTPSGRMVTRTISCNQPGRSGAATVANEGTAGGECTAAPEATADGEATAARDATDEHGSAVVHRVADAHRAADEHGATDERGATDTHGSAVAHRAADTYHVTDAHGATDAHRAADAQEAAVMPGAPGAPAVPPDARRVTDERRVHDAQSVPKPPARAVPATAPRRRSPRRAALPAVPQPAYPAASLLRTAAEVLARLRHDDPRLLLSAADAEHLAPGVAAWLERDLPPDAVRHALTSHLPPEPLRRPAALLAHRLADRIPPLPPFRAPEAPPPVRHPLRNCDGCDRAYRGPDPDVCPGCAERGRIPGIPSKRLS